MTNKVGSFLQDGKRTILVADDEFINREILSEMLKDEYDILKAEDGQQAFEIIKNHSKTLSLGYSGYRIDD